MNRAAESGKTLADEQSAKIAAVFLTARPAIRIKKFQYFAPAAFTEDFGVVTYPRQIARIADSIGVRLRELGDLSPPAAAFASMD